MEKYQAYKRKEDIKAVCTNDEARQVFTESGLTYESISEYDILDLIVELQKECDKSNAICETSMGTLKVNRDFKFKHGKKSGMAQCFITVRSHYFDDRECISFNCDGFIGFAGWADQGNTNPILRGFLSWVEKMARGEAHG